MIRREIIDGRRALVVYLNAAFEPVEPDKATLVKVRFENGEVIFGTPTPQAGQRFGWEDQPRVPAGSGDPSGEWTKMEGESGHTVEGIEPSKAPAAPAPTFLVPLIPSSGENRIVGIRKARSDRGKKREKKEPAAPPKPEPDPYPSMAQGMTSPQGGPSLPPEVQRPDDVAKEITEFEWRQHDADREAALVVSGRTGEVIMERQGTARQVGFNGLDMILLTNRDVVFTHNHPPGWSFSAADICMAREMNAAQMRCSGKDFVTGEPVIYSVDRPPGGWWSEKEENQFLREFQIVQRAQRDYIDGKVKSGEWTERQANYYFFHKVWSEALGPHWKLNYRETRLKKP